MAEQELDVRPLRKPDKHPTIFATYDALEAGESFVLVYDHDPERLRDEFDIEHPGSHRWEYVQREPKEWRVRIGKLATTPLPRVLCDTSAVSNGDGSGVVGSADAAGAVWKLQMRERDLDSNIIHLPAGETIDAHNGPDLDVMIHVLQGGGQLTTELDTLDLAPGMLLWLPKRSRRQFNAGPEGLHYLTVHQRRQTLALDSIGMREQA